MILFVKAFRHLVIIGTVPTDDEESRRGVQKGTSGVQQVGKLDVKERRIM